MTFLFSDIEGSTQRWEQHRAELEKLAAEGAAWSEDQAVDEAAKV